MTTEAEEYKDLLAYARSLYLGLENQTKLESFMEEKKYTQDWSRYEKACSQEKLMFFRILKDAVDFLGIEYSYKGTGRPPEYLADILKAICIKAYHNQSSWRTESDLMIARAMGVLDKVPKRSTILKYLQSPLVAKYLHELYKVIAEPLSEIEMYFAADATGISQKYGNVRWQTVRHTKEEAKKRREYVKLNVISGVKTNAIVSAKITIGTAHESPFFKELLADTSKRFNLREVSADAGYLSKENVKAIANMGAIPFIPGKKNTFVPSKGRDTPWMAMLTLWKKYQPLFASHYHRRSNVESTFSALKRKFGDFCRCKKLETQENEILARIVCFNSAILAENMLSYDFKKGFVAGK